jgi:uncharacterized protein (TIGR03089 family)
VPEPTPERQFGHLLATEPARPFVTYYDEATGERSELSVKSLANWVAKTANLINGELALGPGDRALVAVPAHWISVPILLGVLAAGLQLVPSGEAEVAFVSPETLAAAGDCPEVYAVAPAAAALGFRGDPPAPALDYVTSVRPQPDTWASVALPAGPDDPALPGVSRRELMARAAASGLAPGARVLTVRAWGSPDDWSETLFAPLAVGGSLVVVANAADTDVLERRAAQERVTTRI